MHPENDQFLFKFFRPGWLVAFLIFYSELISAQSNKSVFVQKINEDTVLAVASYQYSNLPFYKKWILGKNYRASWETPVRLPVFYLSKSGLKIDKRGGGKQTNSLHLIDSNNQIWVLRSVEKDVRRGFPSFLQVLPMVPYKQNLISATHPYGALVVAELTKAVGIAAPQPIYYYVGEDDALGELGELVKNSVCMLEKRDPTTDGTLALSTEAMEKKIKEDPNYKILKKQVLKARIFDMLIGDLDRHEGQWRWGVLDSGSVKYFYAIPRDRDHVFYAATGVMALLMKGLLPHNPVSFSGNSGNLRKLNQKALEFDRKFLLGLSQSEWKEMAEIVTAEISDVVIDLAVRKLPPEIFALDGQILITKLQNRKIDFVQNVMEYYQYLNSK